MPNFHFKLDDKELDKLILGMTNSREAVLYEVNGYLHSQGIRIAEQAMIRFTPVSNRSRENKTGRYKNHAKFDPKTYFKNTYDLGFSVKTVKTRNYLFFPNSGKGTSAGKQPLRYNDKAMGSVEAELKLQVAYHLNKAMEQSFKI